MKKLRALTEGEMKQRERDRDFTSSGTIRVGSGECIKNAVRCGICHGPADRTESCFECTNPDCGAIGDLACGIFQRTL